MDKKQILLFNKISKMIDKRKKRNKEFDFFDFKEINTRKKYNKCIEIAHLYLKLKAIKTKGNKNNDDHIMDDHCMVKEVLDLKSLYSNKHMLIKDITKSIQSKLTKEWYNNGEMKILRYNIKENTIKNISINNLFTILNDISCLSSQNFTNPQKRRHYSTHMIYDDFSQIIDLCSNWSYEINFSNRRFSKLNIIITHTQNDKNNENYYDGNEYGVIHITMLHRINKIIRNCKINDILFYIYFKKLNKYSSYKIKRMTLINNNNDNNKNTLHQSMDFFYYYPLYNIINETVVYYININMPSFCYFKNKESNNLFLKILIYRKLYYILLENYKIWGNRDVLLACFFYAIVKFIMHIYLYIIMCFYYFLISFYKFIINIVLCFLKYKINLFYNVENIQKKKNLIPIFEKREISNSSFLHLFKITIIPEDNYVDTKIKNSKKNNKINGEYKNISYLNRKSSLFNMCSKNENNILSSHHCSFFPLIFSTENNTYINNDEKKNKKYILLLSKKINKIMKASQKIKKKGMPKCSYNNRINKNIASYNKIFMLIKNEKNYKTNMKYWKQYEKKNEHIETDGTVSDSYFEYEDEYDEEEDNEDDEEEDEKGEEEDEKDEDEKDEDEKDEGEKEEEEEEDEEDEEEEEEEEEEDDDDDDEDDDDEDDDEDEDDEEEDEEEDEEKEKRRNQCKKGKIYNKKKYKKNYKKKFTNAINEESEREIEKEDNYYFKKKELYLNKKNKNFKNNYIYLNNLYKENAYINIANISNFISVSKDKLTAMYSAWGKHADIACVQINKCALRDCSIYYFEVEILQCTNFSKIVIGMTSKNYTVNKNPGFEYNSFGYKSDDGKKIIDGKLDSYSSGYTKNDIIGCGINYFDNSAFFTKNGKYLGKICTINPKYDYYGTVGLSTLGDKIKFHMNNFIFDIYNLIHEENEKERKIIKSIYIQKDIYSDIIKAHLIKCGYLNTYKSFINFLDQNKNTDDNSSSGCSSHTKNSIDNILKSKYSLPQKSSDKNEVITSSAKDNDKIVKDNEQNNNKEIDKVKLEDTGCNGNNGNAEVCSSTSHTDENINTPKMNTTINNNTKDDTPNDNTRLNNKKADIPHNNNKNENAQHICQDNEVQKSNTNHTTEIGKNGEGSMKSVSTTLDASTNTEVGIPNEDGNNSKNDKNCDSKNLMNNALISYIDKFDKLNKDDNANNEVPANCDNDDSEEKECKSSEALTTDKSVLAKNESIENEDKHINNVKSDEKTENGEKSNNELADDITVKKNDSTVDKKTDDDQKCEDDEKKIKTESLETNEVKSFNNDLVNNCTNMSMDSILFPSRKNNLSSLINARKDSSSILLSRLRNKRSLSTKDNLNMLGANLTNTKKEAKRSETDINKKIHLLFTDKFNGTNNNEKNKKNKKEGNKSSSDKENVSKHFGNLYLSDDKLKKMQDTLETRNTIRNNILNGNIINVLNILENDYSELFTNENGHLHIAMLYTQQLIEILKPHKNFIKKIAKKNQKKSKKYYNNNLEEGALTQSSLKSYEDISDDYFYEDTETESDSSVSLFCDSSNNEENNFDPTKTKAYKNEVKKGYSEVRKRKNLDNYKTNTSKIVEGQNSDTDASAYSSSKGCNSDKSFNKKENNISCDVIDQNKNSTPPNGDILKNNNTTENDNNLNNTFNNNIEKDKNSIVNKYDLKDDDNLNTKKMDQIIYKNIQSNYDKEFFEKNNLQEEYERHYNKLSKEYEFFEDDNPYKNKKFYYGNISNSNKTRDIEQYMNNCNSESEINSDYDSNDSNFKKKYYEFNDIDFDQIYKYIYKKNNVSKNDKLKFKKDHLYLALLWIREKLSLFNNSQNPAIRQCIQDITSLIAYHKPYKQKLVRMFFSKNRNLLTFNSVNEGILGLCLNVPIYSPLEIIIKHLILCRNLLREKKGNIGIKYDCSYVCQPYKRYMITIKNQKKKKIYFKETTNKKKEKGILSGKFTEDNILSVFQ
ncbi:conserved Plasmodium protein, unknown function [Plasmodium chabaudi adami]|uniref:B30.2/SPRY domain-containing protein n=1 Tax=Plasmodium chabaudi adami TaxID=5826 RepID=A0A1C6YI90_PLACE|nr:conserved Plasmodium protein, unknown function [Plasmodium chabaudi adami]